MFIAIPSKLKQRLLLLLKVMVSIACLWYVIHKINWKIAGQTIQRSDLFWLTGAVVFIISSKFIAAFRLNVYFKNIGAILHQKVNRKLYWLGMYYNIFLPGGIGGDAYKVILLNRTYSYPAKLLTAAVLLDRVSGLVGICVLSALYYFGVYKGSNYSYWILALIPVGGVIYYFIVKQFFASFFRSFWSTFWLGLLVQLTQVFEVYCLMNAFNINHSHTEYILIFLLSSLIAVLPFTFGGLGAREVVFIWGSHQFLLNQSESVVISLFFYLISVSISLPGMYWVYNNPLPEEVIVTVEA